jgi:glycosyltransferase involved in cell wall biosynthesis
MMPRVSVILIFLNAANFIQEAIDSVFAQSYDLWELLLVDDGSSDGSSEIAQECARRNPGRARYLEQPNHANRGMSAARNLGIRQAVGDYLAFIDADDVWQRHKLAEQVAILDATPEAGMIYGRSEYWYSWTQSPEDRQRDFVPSLDVPPYTLILPPKLLPLYLRGHAAVPCPTSILLRRFAVVEIGGFDEAFTDIYEDQAFYVKVGLRLPVMAANACWDRYRQHPEASTAVAHRTGREIAARKFFLEWTREYLAGEGVTDVQVWQALRRELWRLQAPAWLPQAGPFPYLVRWLKKWLLRIEEYALPGAASERLWLR